MAEYCIPRHITGLYIFAMVSLCALLNISLVSADVFVIDLDKNSTIDTIKNKQAKFGPDLPSEGLVGRLVYVIPNDACHPVQPPPPEPSELVLPWIALIKRGPCYFDLKVLEAQRAKFSAAILYNNESNNQFILMAGDQYADQVKIPSVFVGYDDGMALARRYNYTHKSIVIKIEGTSDDSTEVFVIPFMVLGSLILLGNIITLVTKCKRYFRRR